MTTSTNDSDKASGHTGGLAFALLAYLVWGFQPLYFHLLQAVPPIELIAWRVLFTVPLCLLFVTVRRQWGELAQIVRSPRILLCLTASAVLIGANWMIFVVAVQQRHVLATSLGYYINPLLNILLGTLLLGERLNRTRWIAVGIAAVGITLLLWGAIDMLGVAMALAVSFALYGLVRKQTPVGAVPGLTVETVLLLLPAAGVAWWFAGHGAGSSIAAGPGTAALLAGTGVLTAIPLLLFAVAARRMDLSTLGFIQFIAPTISFVLGLVAFDEPLVPIKLACFVLIWIAIAVFSRDMWKNRPPRPVPAA